eukprot:918639-Prymnesium_polylepis.2
MRAEGSCTGLGFLKSILVLMDVRDDLPRPIVDMAAEALASSEELSGSKKICHTRGRGGPHAGSSAPVAGAAAVRASLMRGRAHRQRVLLRGRHS